MKENEYDECNEDSEYKIKQQQTEEYTEY